MAKIVIADVLALGFSDKQFGEPADWSAASGYIDSIIDDVAIIVRAKVGTSAYDDATAGGFAERCIANAELAYAEAELWRRRAVRDDANVSVADDSSAFLKRREYSKSAEAAIMTAEDWILQAKGGVAGSGVSFGYIETGGFSATGEGALN